MCCKNQSTFLTHSQRWRVKKAGNLWILATGGRFPLLSADLQNTECPGSGVQELGPEKQLRLNLQQHHVESASGSRVRLPVLGKKVPMC